MQVCLSIIIRHSSIILLSRIIHHSSYRPPDTGHPLSMHRPSMDHPSSVMVINCSSSIIVRRPPSCSSSSYSTYTILWCVASPESSIIINHLPSPSVIVCHRSQFVIFPVTSTIHCQISSSIIIGHHHTLSASCQSTSADLVNTNGQLLTFSQH